MIIWIISVTVPAMIFCQHLGYTTYLKFRSKFPLSRYLQIPYEERSLYTAYGQKEKKPIITKKEYLRFFFSGECIMGCFLTLFVGGFMYFAISLSLGYVIRLYDKSYHVNSESRDTIAYFFLAFLYYFTIINLTNIHNLYLKDELERVNREETIARMPFKS